MAIQEFQIGKIKFDLHYQSGNKRKLPLVLFIHGFKSFRRWGFIPFLCEEISKENFLVLNFDFSMNGVISEYPVHFDNAIFSKNTVKQELEDTSNLLEYLLGQRENNINDNELNMILGDRWDGTIFLLGHSRGGAIAMLTSLLFSEVKKIALLATIAYFDRYTERLKKEWAEKGLLEFQDTMSKQVLQIDYSYIKDIEQNKEKYNLLESANKINIPVLFVHGNNDLSVKYNEAKEIFTILEKNQKSSCNFVIIKNANHLFNVSHPFIQTNKYLDEALKIILKFLKENEAS